MYRIIWDLEELNLLLAYLSLQELVRSGCACERDMCKVTTDWCEQNICAIYQKNPWIHLHGLLNLKNLH